MGFVKNLLRYLNPFGGVVAATDAANGEFKNLSSAFDSATDKMDSFINAQTGGVTERDNAMMDYQTQEREAAQNWTAQREDTELQRRMADLLAAGINPMMAAGGGVSSSSQGQAAPSSANAASLSNLFQLATLGPQIDLMKAQAENLRSQAQNRNILTPAQVEQINQNIEESKKRVEKMDSDIERNAALNALSYAQEHLANVSAEDLQQLRSSRIKLNEARTTEAKAQAALASINKLYQSKLIEEGMPHAVVEKIMAEKNLADAEKRGAVAKAVTNEIINGRMTGSFTATIDRILREQGIESTSTRDTIIGALFNFADAVNITL